MREEASEASETSKTSESKIPNVVDVKKPKDWSANGLIQVGETAIKNALDSKGEKREKEQHDKSKKHKASMRITVGCKFWFHLKVVEGNDFWEEFWKIDDALEFNQEILQIAKTAQHALRNRFGAIAQDHARNLGYKFDQDMIRYGGYHVVHLRAEQDWHAHCKVWFSWSEKRDNCMNNTFQIGNVLLSEGITPALPVYLATGLSEAEIQDLRNSKSPSMKSFFNIYTIVTKGMLGLPMDVGNKREYWAAVDNIFSQNAEWFIGNSISTFSALAMEVRARLKMPILPYNGGTMALEDMNLIRSKSLTMIPPMRPGIKWFFTLPASVRTHDLTYNMTIVAVKSALAKTELIPVAVVPVLAEDAVHSYRSPVVVKLVSMGVRVIYHRPTWLEKAEESLPKNVTLTQRDTLMAQWLRIDIPILGLLDDFVFYTDLDVLFIHDIFWKELLGKDHLHLRDSLLRQMLDKTKKSSKLTNFEYANATGGSDGSPGASPGGSPGGLGIPEFLGAADRWGKRVGTESESTESTEFEVDDESIESEFDYDCGVMLMNLRTLRESHDDFRQFVLKQQQLLKSNLHVSDPCYYNFYRKSNLPSRLIWKPQEPHASLVHFEGINCHDDVERYIKRGKTRSQFYTQRVKECFDLEFCHDSYVKFCLDYKTYLTYA